MVIRGLWLTLLVVSLTIPTLSTTNAEAVKTCFGRRATIVGTPAADEVLVGTEGRDVIVGRGGKDTVFGMGGNDLICGNRSADNMMGGIGHDRINGGKGRDNCDAEVRRRCETGD